MTSNDARSGRPVPPDGFTAPENPIEGERSAFSGMPPVATPAPGMLTFEGDEVWLTGPAVIVARGEYWS